MLIANATFGFWMGDYNGTWERRHAANLELKELQKSSQTPPDKLATAREKFDEADQPFQSIKKRKGIHFLLGLVTSLIVVLVNSVAVTYFVGTSKWCAEVVDSYSLDFSFTQRSTALKRKTFPWAVAGMLTVLAIVIFGAMSDPYVRPEDSANFVTLHSMIAILGMGIVAWSFLVQVGNIGANFEVIEDILSEVRRIRAERGLDDTTEAGKNV